jgi:HNH endonuclease
MHTTRCRRVRLGRKKTILTAERLRELLHYDPITGEFTWLVSRRGHTKAGDKAGTLKGPDYDRVQIFIQGRIYTRYRLAWLYMTGEWPKAEIDHKDCNPMNDTWDNLREATRGQNMGNCSRGWNNSTGYKGVQYNPRWKKKYIAVITHNYKGRYLGSYSTPQEAHLAYARAAKELRGEFARTA